MVEFPRFVLPPQEHDSPLDTACRGLGLNLFEAAVIALCLLPEIDARYGALIGFLHDDVTRKAPSVELALALFAPAGAAGLPYLSCFAPHAALQHWQLVHSGPEESLIRQPLRLDRAFLWFLFGVPDLDPALEGVARVAEAEQIMVAPMPAAAGRPGRWRTGRPTTCPSLWRERADLPGCGCHGRARNRPAVVTDRWWPAGDHGG